MSKIELENDNGCFVCGKLNMIGLKLDFEIVGDEYVTYFTPMKEHQGWAGIVHGGIISTVLDEVMARYVYILGHEAVTAEMTVRLKRPAQVGKRLRFASRIESVDTRVIATSARATDGDGCVIATATARMVRV